MRKCRSDAVLLNLPEEKRQQIAEWLLSGLPLHQVKVLIEKEFGLRAPLSVISRFWQQVCAPFLALKRRRAVETADSIADEMAKLPGKTWDQATLEMLKQKAFELTISPQAAPKDVKALLMLVLKADSQETDKAKLALDVGRFQRDTCELFVKWFEDKRAQSVAAGSTSNADKIEALGQLMFKDTWK